MFKVQVSYDPGQDTLQIEKPHFDLQNRDGQVEWVFKDLPGGSKPLLQFGRDDKEGEHGPFSELVAGASRVYGIDNQGGRELFHYTVSLVDETHQTATLQPVQGSFWNDYDPEYPP